MRFANRTVAGRELARRLAPYGNRDDVIVLAIPRGGVPVALEVALELKAPLDVFVLRKLGVPGQEELAFGAIASGGVRVLDQRVVQGVGLSEQEIESVTAQERLELARRENVYRGGMPPLNVRGRTVILVDDGVATGSSMRAAIAAVRLMSPARIVVAIPVAPVTTCTQLKSEADEFVCVHAPRSFQAVGQFYEDFGQVTDEEVKSMLLQAVCDVTKKGA
jgi:putative phosphoribosyl transferase